MFLSMYNLNVKQFLAEMRLHIIPGLIWVQIVDIKIECAASRQSVNEIITQ